MTASLPTAATRADRGLAAVLFGVGLAVGIGGALEFRYFGPDAPQFWAGVAATPAAALALAAAVQLWRRGIRARPLVGVTAIALFAATAIGAALRVMGPPAILLGFLGAVAAGWWTRTRRSTT